MSEERLDWAESSLPAGQFELIQATSRCSACPSILLEAETEEINPQLLRVRTNSARKSSESPPTLKRKARSVQGRSRQEIKFAEGDDILAESFRTAKLRSARLAKSDIVRHMILL